MVLEDGERVAGGAVLLILHPVILDKFEEGQISPDDEGLRRGLRWSGDDAQKACRQKPRLEKGGEVQLRHETGRL